MQNLTIRRVVVVASLIVLAGCGASGALAGIGGAGAPTGAGTAAPEPPSTATWTPAAAAGPPSSLAPPGAPSVAPARLPARPPAAQPPTPMAFAITPQFPLGPAGSIAVLVSPAGVHYHLIVTGLVAGSVHTIHDHIGTCGSPSTSRHLSVLATVAADSRGVIVVDTTVPAVDFGAGRIVIVYDSARPVFISGCATL